MSTASKGYYSLIQYCPDRSRLESANLGVVLFCPERGFLDARLARGHDRLRKFFGASSFDPRLVEAAKRAIANRLRLDRQSFGSIEDFERFVATRANALTLTSVRPMKVIEPAEELERLFSDLVGGRVRTSRTAPWRQTLDRVFRRDDLRNRVEFDREVRVPLVGRTLKAPYAFQNGLLNLIKPQEFSADEGRATNVAMRLALEGDLLDKHGTEDGESAQLIVIPTFVPDAAPSASLRSRILTLFGEYAVRTVALESVDDFGEEVRRTAH